MHSKWPDFCLKLPDGQINLTGNLTNILMFGLVKMKGQGANSWQALASAMDRG